MTQTHGFWDRVGRFGLVGIAHNLTVYALFLLLVWAGSDPVIASALCYCLGVLLSYLLNRRWTFQSTSGHVRDFPRFLLAYGCGLVVTVIAMSLLVPLLGPAWAQLVTIAIAATTIFGTLTLLRFGEQ